MPQYPDEVKHAVNYACKAYHLQEDTKIRWYKDILQEAMTGYLEGNSFKSARNRAGNFIYNQIINSGLTGGSGFVYKKVNPLNELFIHQSHISCLILARFIYRLLGKKGKRGRHSSALKSMILIDRAEGLEFQVIASKYDVTIPNCIRHYRMAWTIIRNFLIKNQNMLSDDQKILLGKITRADVKNFNSERIYYEYAKMEEENATA